VTVQTVYPARIHADGHICVFFARRWLVWIDRPRTSANTARDAFDLRAGHPTTAGTDPLKHPRVRGFEASPLSIARLTVLRARDGLVDVDETNERGLDRPAGEFDRNETVASRKAHGALTTSQFHAVARALADPRRMELLEAIGRERECPCQRLCQQSGVTKGTVSHHMRELLRAGLVTERREGQYLFYEVRREVLAAYAAELIRRVAHVTNG